MDLWTSRMLMHQDALVSYMSQNSLSWKGPTKIMESSSWPHTGEPQESHHVPETMLLCLFSDKAIFSNSCVYYSHLLNSCFAPIPQENTENEIQWKNWCKCLQLCISYYKTATVWKCYFFYLKCLKKHVIKALINWLRFKQLSLKDSFWRPSRSFWDFIPFIPLLLSSELLVYLVASFLCSISHFSIDFIGFILSLEAFFLSQYWHPPDLRH